MNRLGVFVVVAIACAAFVGCGRAATPEPKKPPLPSETRTQAEPPRHEEEPDLIAPPPAYGNKVVMAGARHESRVH